MSSVYFRLWWVLEQKRKTKKCVGNENWIMRTWLTDSEAIALSLSVQPCQKNKKKNQKPKTVGGGGGGGVGEGGSDNWE